MKILAIESAAKQASCAIVQDGTLIAQAYIDAGMTHSQTLMPMVESLLSSARLPMEEIGLFAVSAGPGSFTGVRIGISAAKGMAAAMQAPCAGVSTLEAMAENLRLPFDFYSCAVMDARREQVYNALFRHSGGEIARLCGDRAISVTALGEELSSLQDFPIILVGDGTDLCYNTIADLPGLFKAPAHLRFAHASGVAFAAARIYREGRLPDPGDLVPRYLRLSQAERELSARNPKERRQ